MTNWGKSFVHKMVCSGSLSTPPAAMLHCSLRICQEHGILPTYEYSTGTYGVVTTMVVHPVIIEVQIGALLWSQKGKFFLRIPRQKFGFGINLHSTDFYSRIILALLNQFKLFVFVT